MYLRGLGMLLFRGFGREFAWLYHMLIVIRARSERGRCGLVDEGEVGMWVVKRCYGLGRRTNIIRWVSKTGI